MYIFLLDLSKIFYINVIMLTYIINKRKYFIQIYAVIQRKNLITYNNRFNCSKSYFLRVRRLSNLPLI